MKRFVTAAFVLFGGAAHATSLKELVDAADKANIDKQISVEQRRRAVAETTQAWTALLPSLTVQGLYTNNQYSATFAQPVYAPDNNGFVKVVPDPTTGKPEVVSLTIQPGNQVDAIFRADLPIIDTTRWLRTGAAVSSEAAAVQREDLTGDNVHRQVISTWYSYAAAIAVRDSAERSSKVAEAQQQLQEIRAKAGAATQLDLLRARAEVQRNHQVISDSAVAVATTRRSLQTLTGVDPGDSAPLPQDDMRPEPPFQELEKNVDNLPAIRAAVRDAEAAGRLAMAADLALVPTVGGAFIEHLTNATSFTGQIASYQVGLTATWRLDGPTVSGIKVQSEIEQTALLQIERQRLLARDQIHSDWQRLNAALQKTESAKSQVEAATQADQVARDRYAVGAAEQIDVITAERDLFGAEVSVIQARTELATARFSLHISAGQPLGL